MIVGKDTVMVRKRYDRPVLSLCFCIACTGLRISLVPTKGGDAYMDNLMFEGTSWVTVRLTASLA